MGAGVIPVSWHEGRVLFLFQKVFTGRKADMLIDFGGGLGAAENYRQTAAREFVEETETMYLAEDPAAARRTPHSVAHQSQSAEKIFSQTLERHPDWLCRRATTNPRRPKDWITFFVVFPYRDVEPLNRLWERDPGGHYKKRRELVWVEAGELIRLYDQAPEKLWKRVRQLEGARELVAKIERSLTAGGLQPHV